MFKRITCFFLGHKLWAIESTPDGKVKCYCSRCRKIILKEVVW